MTVQGQGEGTRRKLTVFYHANAVGMCVVASHPKLARHPFWLFDGNCGSGWNEEVGVLGSPFVAHEAADEAGLSFARRRFFFCDKDEGRMRLLQRRLANRPDYDRCSYLLPGDNEDALDVFAEAIRANDNPAYAVGSIVIDPNGYYYRNQSGDGPPVGKLAAFTKEFPRIDIILNLNIRTYLLQLSQGHDVSKPDEVLRSLSKKHWLVGRINTGNSRFLVAVGRNFHTDEHRRIRLHDITNAMGREVMLWAETGQRRRQAVLFNGALPKLSRLSASPDLPRRPVRGHEARQLSMLPVPAPGDGNSPPPISTVGDVRHSGEPGGDLP